MKVITKEKRKKKGALGFVSHAKVKMVSKQKKKPRLPLITAYKHLKQKNSELAKTINNKLEEIKELKEKNVHLMSKNIGLTLAYKKQAEAFVRLERQSKNALAIIPGFVDSIGEIISTCQRYNSSTNLPHRFDEANESQKRHSQGTPIKSPSCVVLPTVSGHTITKPTINLSRLNIERVVNSPNLSRIEESSPSPRNSLVSRSHSQTNGRISTQNQESMRIGNISERLDTTNLSTDEEESHRTSERVQLPPKRQPSRNRRSSMFERLSLSRYSIAPSPRVQLKDVSKVLRNSQSINVRVLDERLSNGTRTEIAEEISHNTSSSNSSMVSNQSFDSVVDNTQNNNESNSDSVDENQNDTNKTEPSRLSNECSGSASKNETSLDNVDPLEGTSWKYGSVEQSSADLLKDESLYSNKRLQNDDSEDEDEEEEEKVDDEEDRTRQVVNYVNFEQRGSIADMDDFTLFIKKNKPPRRTRFNISDYSLPNLDVSLLEPLERRPEIPEIDDITCTMINITEKIKSYHPKPEAFDDQDLMTVKLPREPSMLVESTPLPLPMRKRKSFTPIKVSLDNAEEEEEEDEEEEEHLIPAKIAKKQSKVKKLEKDPSAAKVVLKKLKSSRSEKMAGLNSLSPIEVDERLSSPSKNIQKRGRSKKNVVPIIFSDSDSEEEFDNKQLKQKTKAKSHISEPSHRGDTSDSECSVESSSKNSRPKRKAAPKSLAEPKLNRKMRRSK